MRVFDRVDPAALERRDWQLWMLALAVILILAGGVALLMYPAVFSNPFAMTGPTLHKVFFGFCILSFLLVGYLIDRHLLIRRLRRELAEEHQQSVELVEQASADLLASLPRFEHFQDRLAMEFRRAAHIEQPLSLLMVGLRASEEVVATEGAAATFGDAAKALIRRLRREDSIYMFRPGVFGIVLPGVSIAGASCVSTRLEEGLMDASGADNRFTFQIRLVNFPEHAATAREMEQMAVASFPEPAREAPAAAAASGAHTLP